MERIPGHVRNWGSGGERERVQFGESLHSATAVQCITVHCSAAQCSAVSSAAAGGEISVQGEINGCIGGRLKKSGLDGADE